PPDLLSFPTRRSSDLARGRVVIFANSDIEVLPGAVDAMLCVLDTDPSVGAVGPRVLRVDGQLDDAEVSASADGPAPGGGRKDGPDRKSTRLNSSHSQI